jgi:hypothetical protein
MAGLLLLAAAAGCTGGSATAEVSASAGEPMAAEPAGPPPPLATKLAEPAAPPPAAGSSIDTQVTRAAELAAQLEADLAQVSFEGTAPASLIAAGGGRQAEVAKSDIPPHERWEIRFPAGNSIESYTRQLDFFKIELGVIGGEDYITYLTNLSNPKPKTRPGFASDEKRLYLVWQRGAMSEADEQLAARAGAKTAGKVLAHFIPSEVETELTRMEEAFARQLGIQKIQKTVFGIRVAGQDSFRFYVIEQKADLR